MRSRVGVLPVRILKVWFDVVLVLGGAATLVFLLWLALSPFLMATGRGMATDATVQVAVGARSWLPVYPLELEPLDRSQDLGIEQAALVHGRGELRLLTSSWGLHVSSLGEILLGSLVVLYVIWILRRVVVNVLEGRPFAAANGIYLRRAGYLVLVAAIVFPGLDWVVSDYVLSRIAVTNLDLRPAVTLDKDVFVVGLMLVVFGVILTHGHRLQERERALEEEQALTI